MAATLSDAAYLDGDMHVKAAEYCRQPGFLSFRQRRIVELRCPRPARAIRAHD